MVLWNGPFFDSNLFQTLVAISTVGFALWKYTNDKNEKKKQAANIILNEVDNAESEIKTILRTSSVTQETVIMPIESWSKLLHLFSEKELSAPAKRLITDFYRDCVALDKFVEKAKDNLWDNHSAKRYAIMHELGKAFTIPSALDTYDKVVEENINKINNFDKNDYIYNPKIVTELIFKIANSIKTLKGTTAYKELKEQAK